MAENLPPFKRKVFYIAGFDPRGAGHYHRLYKQHAALQSSVGETSYDVSLRRRMTDLSHGWDVRASVGGRVAETIFEFLSWNDIVRQQWHEGISSIAQCLMEFFRHYVFSGLFFFFGKRAPQQLIAGFYPAVFILLSVAACLFLAYIFSKPLEGMMAALAAMAVFAGSLKICLMIAEKYAVFWVLRILVFSSRWSRGGIAGMNERIEFFSSRIAESLQEEYDEIMLVSHSVGCMVSVPVIAETLRRAAGSDKKIVVLTLGQCIPLMSFQPQADDYRRDLEIVAHDPRIIWWDYTARTDGACFPLLDFVTASGITRRETANLRILSPRFFMLYKPQHYRRLRFNWYKMHFLYLLSTDYAGGYDYFSMTAGTAPLSTQDGGE